MKKEHNEWSIKQDGLKPVYVNINGNEYLMGEDGAAMCHALLLLVDAINDKDFYDKPIC